MSKQIEALKLALEIALEKEYLLRKTGQSHVIEPVITAIREALAEQPAQQQEPVAWMRHDGERVTTAADRKNYPDYETRFSIPLYTSPQPSKPWQGLTDEEIESLQRLAIDPVDANGWGFLNRERFAYLVEIKLREKNS